MVQKIRQWESTHLHQESDVVYSGRYFCVENSRHHEANVRDHLYASDGHCFMAVDAHCTKPLCKARHPKGAHVCDAVGRNPFHTLIHVDDELLLKVYLGIVVSLRAIYIYLQQSPSPVCS